MDKFNTTPTPLPRTASLIFFALAFFLSYAMTNPLNELSTIIDFSSPNQAFWFWTMAVLSSLTGIFILFRSDSAALFGILLFLVIMLYVYVHYYTFFLSGYFILFFIAPLPLMLTVFLSSLFFEREDPFYNFTIAFYSGFIPLALLVEFGIPLLVIVAIFYGLFELIRSIIAFIF